MLDGRFISKTLVSAIIAAFPIIGGSLLSMFASQSSPAENSEWYQNLDKPAYNPPPLAFSIAWPLLYALMGISVFLSVFGQRTWYVVAVYALLFLNLVFNFAYPFLMFRERRLLVAAVDVWLTLLTSLLLFGAIVYGPVRTEQEELYRSMAVWMWVPYVLWLTFASILATDIYLMNRKKKGRHS